ncbi:MAG: hypothetical protein KGZ66_10660 [Selenomonadales bacterium]|nr:hypothetical protein [Selenomonadales bacterium]
MPCSHVDSPILLGPYRFTGTIALAGDAGEIAANPAVQSAYLGGH